MNSQNYRECEVLGEFYTLFQQMLEDEKRFYIYFRMTKDCFNDILNLIGDDVCKEYTNYRRPIPPEERLAIVLR
jgi:hypothetical protein